LQARVNLKLICLLHDSVTLPGSLAIEDSFVRVLLTQLLPFVNSGILKLDLRSSCNSFNDLAAQKFPDEPPIYVSRMAELLDKTCKETLLFDANNASQQYINELSIVLDSFHAKSRRRTVESEIEKAINRLSEADGVLTLQEALELLQNTYLDKKFKALAKLLYSTIGAKVTNSQAVIPSRLWQDALSISNKLLVSTLNATPRQLADNAVMDYFSVDSQAVDKLGALDIIELKQEPLTNRYIKELDNAIEAATDSLGSDGRIEADIVGLAEDRAEEIRKAIHARCQRERRNLKLESYLFGAVDEAGGFFGGLVGIGPIKKGLTILSRKMAKKNKRMEWLDYTSAPLVTYVSRYRDFIEQKRSDL